MKITYKIDASGNHNFTLRRKCLSGFPWLLNPGQRIEIIIEKESDCVFLTMVPARQGSNSYSYSLVASSMPKPLPGNPGNRRVSNLRVRPNRLMEDQRVNAVHETYEVESIRYRGVDCPKIRLELA